LELATAPETEKQQRELEKAMGFGLRQAIGESIFALTACWPDIAVPVIEVSQCAPRPAPERHLFVLTQQGKMDSCIGAKLHVPPTCQTFRTHKRLLQMIFNASTQTITVCPLCTEQHVQPGEELIALTDDPQVVSKQEGQQQLSAVNADTFQQPLLSVQLRQNLSAWLTLEKQPCACNPFHRMCDSTRNTQPRYRPATEALRRWRLLNSQRVEEPDTLT
jgi:hypothetical protein